LNKKMLNNIFKKSKSRKKPELKPKIIVDIHEKNSLVPSYLKELGAEVEFKSLKVGDYLVGNIAIERKTYGDLASSIVNKRLHKQLKQLQQYKQNLLLIENEHIGKLTSLHPNAITGQLLSSIFHYQVPIINTSGPAETARTLIVLAKQQLKPMQEISLHSRIPKTRKEQQKYLIESFPNIGPKKAEQLLKQFKTPLAVFNAPLKEIEKILKKQASDFKDLLE